MQNISAIFLVILLALLCSCVPSDGGDGNYNSFRWELRGTWVAPTPKPGLGEDVFYYPEIEIDYNYIIIRALPGSIAHFEGITPNVKLEGYSTSDSLLYIRDRGEWQIPIKYILWEEAGSSYPRAKIITLKSNSLIDETFIRVELE